MSGQYIDLNKVIPGKPYNKITNEHTGAHTYIGVAHVISGFREPLKIQFVPDDVTAKPTTLTYYDSNKKPNRFTAAFYGGKRTRKMRRRMSKSRRTRR